LANTEDQPPGNSHPFDVETVRHLVRLMSRHDLSEIDLSEGERRIRIRRGLSVRMQAAPAAPALPAPVAPAPPPTPAPPAGQAEQPAPAVSKLIEITSPTPGTFYSKPDPDSPPFVKVGGTVTPDTVVCLVEAMKMFNEIKAECSGRVVEAVAENGQFVEYGTVLFRVDPS
jgi:acetyl-CoA carboxylase biotin carboxyl carrier protein